MEWKTGDWVVFEMKIGQIKELRGEGHASFSDGFCETSGKLEDRFRPLTLRNKRIAETFDIYYRRLRGIDGEVGFNYPDISSYFSELALRAIDDENSEESYELANQFVRYARDYKPVIQGIPLFRRKLRMG